MFEGIPFHAPARPDPSNLNAPRDTEGNTYLHELCALGAPPALIAEAIKLGADPNALNRKKLPPLALAITKGKPETVAAMIDAGAELYFKTGEKTWGEPRQEFFNATYLAAIEGLRDKLDVVLAKGGGAFVNCTGMDADGSASSMTPLHAAIKKSKTEFIAPLHNAGAFLDVAAGGDGSTPLFIAIANNSATMVNRLAELGAGLECRHADTFNTPLLYAAFHDKAWAAEKLIRLGADVNAVNKDGKTALMLAAEQGSIKMVGDLLKAGAKPNAKTAKGETALMYAAEKGQTEVINMLVRGGADPLLADVFNKTALAHASDKNASYYTRTALEEAEKTALLKSFEKSYKKYRP